MKKLLKQQLTLGDFLLIATNLIPIWGVWFKGWDAKMMFLVYCFESIIIGIYNFFQLWLTTLVKKKDVWENNGTSSIVSGYVFMFFFLAHYGFFVFIQMTIFLNIVNLKNESAGVFDFVLHFYKYMPSYALWLLLLFAITYGFIVLKEFVFTGVYKTIDMGALMFAPYGRIFVQQFVVILGSFILLFSTGGKIFILIFVLVKIFFELLLDYKKIITEAVEKRKANRKD
jgi:hypothetical protein